LAEQEELALISLSESIASHKNSPKRKPAKLLVYSGIRANRTSISGDELFVAAREIIFNTCFMSRLFDSHDMEV
jgi:hypothetical protein